jgi:uncharacterized protein YbjT (DUF2867 family)
MRAMKIAIAGGHGQIALLLTRLLSERGDNVTSLIRNPDHAGDVREGGGEPVTCDLEAAGDDDVAGAIEGTDAIVFAAGAGPGSGPARKQTMDYGGVVKLIAAAKQKDIARYLIVSSMGANPDAPDDSGFNSYLRAKGMADADLEASGLDYTVVRPTRLTDDPGTGLVDIGAELSRSQIPREDVAAVLAAALETAATIGKTFQLTAGKTPIAEALAGLNG